jgi:hypothetical protein
MIPSTVVSGTQLYNNSKMRSSKCIIESNIQKKMAKSGFACKFYDLKCSELGIFLSYSLNSLFIWGRDSQIFVFCFF